MQVQWARTPCFLRLNGRLLISVPHAMRSKKAFMSGTNRWCSLSSDNTSVLQTSSPKYSSNSQPEPGPPAPDKAITKPNSNLHLNQNLKPSPDSAPKPQKRSDTNGAGEKHTGIQIEARPGMTFLGLGFSSVDMSLCVLLYALSCVFLMFMFFFFHFRSKRWKTRNYRPYV